MGKTNGKFISKQEARADYWWLEGRAALMNDDDDSAGLAHQQELEKHEYLEDVLEQLLEQVNAELKLWGKENERT